MSEEARAQRLPPPAFPPGLRGTGQGASDAKEQQPDLALISPDEPLPDRPFDHEEEGVVTGIGDETHVHHESGVPGSDPALADLVRAVTSLAEGLRRKGQAGLKVTPTMSRFEATLRAYCVGYLAGRRAELSGDGEGAAD